MCLGQTAKDDTEPALAPASTNTSFSSDSPANNASSSSSSSPSSRGRTVLSRLNEIDEALSRPIFSLCLPRWIELPFSVPANFFGTNATLTIGPLWIALLAVRRHDEWDGEPRALALGAVTVSVTAIYVAAWCSFQCWSNHGLGLTLFWNKPLYAMACPWAVAVLSSTLLNLPGYDSRAIYSTSLYPLTLWPFVVVVMNGLKAATTRTRPAKKDLVRGLRTTTSKQYPASTMMLAKYSAHESFPSGDVMMATLIAIPLGTVEEGAFRGLAASIVMLSMLGRMYVLAHHLSDVVAGALLTLAMHGLAGGIGYEMQGVEWWHPLATMGGFVAFEVWTKKSHNPMERQVHTHDD